MNFVLARRVLALAAFVCFLVALVVALGVDGVGTNPEWLAGGLLSFALERVIT